MNSMRGGSEGRVGVRGEDAIEMPGGDDKTEVG